MANNSFRTVQPPTNMQFRNTNKLVQMADSNFEAAHFQGVMALYAAPSEGRFVHLEGQDKPIIDFVRCSYLGLDNHPKIVDGAVEAIRMSGSLHWSCARTRLNFTLLSKLEQILSELFQARAITYTSVLAANMSSLPLIASGHLTSGIKPTMVFDRFAHATLAFHKATVASETSVRTIPHADYGALEDICRKEKCVAFICDGVYSMGGSCNIDELKRLQEKYGLFLYIDDAHGVSIIGDRGRGFARSQFGDLGDKTIIASSLGKGFGASGGLLLLGTANQEVIFRRFAVAHAFSASINTAAIGAAIASASIHQSPELYKKQKKLRENIALFDSLMQSENDHPSLPIRTISVGDEMAAIGCAQELLKHDFYASAIFFPTVARGEAGLRVSLTADHEPDQIERFCSTVSNLLGLPPAGGG